MEHVDPFVGFNSKVSLIAHQQFDKLHVTMEGGEVQRVEALFGKRRRVDPVRYVFANLLLYVDDHVCV